MRTTPRFDTLARHVFPEQSESRLFHWEHHTVASRSVFYHYHPQFELNLLQAENARRIVGDDEALVEGADLVLISPNLPHRWELQSGSAEFWVIAFSRESLGLELLSRTEMAAVRTLLENSDRGLVFDRSMIPAVAPAIKRIGSADGLTSLALFAQVLHAICGAGRAEPIASPGYQGSGAEEEYATVARVVEHFMSGESLEGQRRPRLEEAAAVARMSVPTFTRFFRRMTGDSFVPHINRLRIARACALLEETTTKIVDVAMSSGFANLSHFNRQFKRFSGIAPGEYRRQRRG